MVALDSDLSDTSTIISSDEMLHYRRPRNPYSIVIIVTIAIVPKRNSDRIAKLRLGSE